MPLSAADFRRRRKKGSETLYIEPEVHHVAFLHDVALAFQPELARLLRTLLPAKRDELVVGGYLRTNESALEVGVDARLDRACRRDRAAGRRARPCRGPTVKKVSSSSKA